MRIRRAGQVLLAVAAVVMVQIAVVVPSHAAGGLPVVIDDFNGNTLGTRTVVPLPAPGTSTTAAGTFQQNGDGTATMTMNGHGNGVGGVELDYTPASPVDLTSGGTDTQFFIDFHAIQRLPVQSDGETALNLTVQVTDSRGREGTLQHRNLQRLRVQPGAALLWVQPAAGWTSHKSPQSRSNCVTRRITTASPVSPS